MKIMPDRETIVHNVRFYKPKTRAIYCMALNKENEQLAVSRSDASIEIWNLTNAPFLERTLPSCTKNFSVEGLAWTGGRLFSVGLHGLLVEYDLRALSVKSQAVVTGEAAFCLDVNRAGTEIVVGTEQGYLNMFAVSADDATFDRFLDKQEGRILCVKYDHSGRFVVSGSMDAIRVWSAATGHALHKMTTGRSAAKKATIVWCLAVTEDFTIVSGDSRGRLTFWDGRAGAQVDSYQTHRADILAVCLADDGRTLYCAGIDPSVAIYERAGAKWAKSVERRIHEHDVRALVSHGRRLFSGGVDGYLACSSFPPRVLVKYPPVLRNCAAIAGKARLALLRYPKHVEVWQFTELTGNFGEDGRTHAAKPKKMLELKRTTKSDDAWKREGVLFTTISSDGRFILFATSTKLRLFEYTKLDDREDELTKIDFDDNLADCIPLNGVFTKENHLIIAPSTGGLLVCGLEGKVSCLRQRISTEKEISDTITFLALSKSETYLVAGDPQSNIAIWTLVKGQYQFYSKFPKYQSHPTALAIDPSFDNLVVVYADMNIIEYNLKKRQLTEFSRNIAAKLPNYWLKRHHTIFNITFDLCNPNIIILQDFSNITILNKSKKIENQGSKIPKIDLGRNMNDVTLDKNQCSELCLYSIKKYKHLVHLNWLSDDEMVSVEVNPLTLVEQLPPCLVQSTFGRK